MDGEVGVGGGRREGQRSWATGRQRRISVSPPFCVRLSYPLCPRLGGWLAGSGRIQASNVLVRMGSAIKTSLTPQKKWRLEVSMWILQQET